MIAHDPLIAPRSDRREKTPPFATTSERQIWEAAIILVREHGEDAAIFAGQEALKHRGEPDQLKYLVWSWITRVTRDLIKPEPDWGEYLH
jgi:hypothetical protein